jgi:hypothetical protein
MPQVSRVAKLPVHVRGELDARLLESGFSGYAALALELRARGHRISKSSIHRYGMDLRERLKVERVSRLADKLEAKE